MGKNTFFQILTSLKIAWFLDSILFLPWSDGWWLITKCSFLFLFFGLKNTASLLLRGCYIIRVFLSCVPPVFNFQSGACEFFYSNFSPPFTVIKHFQNLEHTKICFNTGNNHFDFYFFWLDDDFYIFLFYIYFAIQLSKWKMLNAQTNRIFLMKSAQFSSLFFISLVFNFFLFVFFVCCQLSLFWNYWISN